MARMAQGEIHKELINKLSNIYPLTVQDLRTTNSLLRKANIGVENLDDIEIEELQDILGVDNIISVKVQFTVKTQESAVTSVGTTNTKKPAAIGSTVKTETAIYKYKIHFDLYKNGVQTYTKSREPVFNTQDAWLDGITYLLKRSPIYSK